MAPSATAATSDPPIIKAVGNRRRSRKKLRTPNPEVRRRLLEAAEELIEEEGFPDLRVDSVSRRAGLSVGTFYLYFEGKHDLFTSLVVDHTVLLLERLKGAQAGSAPVVIRLARRLEAYLDFVEQHRRTFLFFRSAGTVKTTAGDLYQWVARQHQDELVPLLEEGIASNELRCEDPVLMAQALYGLFTHLVGYWLENPEQYSRDEIRDFIIQFGWGQFGSVA